MKLIRYTAYKSIGNIWPETIPAHWALKKLGYLAILKSGENITAERIDVDGKYPVFGGNGTRGFTENFTHDGNFVLIGRQGALCGNINYAMGRFWASEHAVVVSPLVEFETRWMGELLRSMDLNQYSISAAQPGLSVAAIRALKIPVPPLEEQQAISRFVGLICRPTDTLIGVQTRIDETYGEPDMPMFARLASLMAEYRAALVTAAVTGQIDVRTYRPQEAAAVCP